MRAVLVTLASELAAELCPAGREPVYLDPDAGDSLARYCAGCAPGRWDRTAAALRARGWSVRASRAVLVLLADLAARGAV